MNQIIPPSSVIGQYMRHCVFQVYEYTAYELAVNNLLSSSRLFASLRNSTGSSIFTSSSSFGNAGAGNAGLQINGHKDENTSGD